MLLLYMLQQKKTKKKKQNSYSIYQICGYSIYSENIILNENIPKCDSLKLCCKNCNNCLCNAICSTLTFCPCDACDEEKEENYDDYTCCCCWCCNLDQIVYNKNNEFFCYCYQEKRKSKWCNEYIIKEITKDVFPLIVIYFILQFTVIGFERQISNNTNIYINITDDNNNTNTNDTHIINETDINNNTDYIYSNYFTLFTEVINNYKNQTNNDSYFKENIIFIFVFLGSFILFLYLTISFSRIIVECCNHENNKKRKGKISKLSNQILNGTYGIVLFNSVFSFIFSCFELSKNEGLKNIIEILIIFIFQF